MRARTDKLAGARGNSKSETHTQEHNHITRERTKEKRGTTDVRDKRALWSDVKRVVAALSD